MANDVVVSSDPRPSYEELAALVARQADLLARQDVVIVQLEAEVRELKRQLKRGRCPVDDRGVGSPVTAGSRGLAVPPPNTAADIDLPQC